MTRDNSIKLKEKYIKEVLAVDDMKTHKSELKVHSNTLKIGSLFYLLFLSFVKHCIKNV